MGSMETLNLLEPVNETDIQSGLTGDEVFTEALPGLLSDDVFHPLLQATVSVGFLISLFALAGNFINVIVYVRMGMEESTNVSLAALAISDFFIVLTAIGTGLTLVLPPFENIPLGKDVTMTTVVYPHIVFTRISALITAFISVERYLCVCMPLRIKSMFTPRRTLVAVVIIYCAAFLPLIAIYFKYPMGWKMDRESNRTIYGVISAVDHPAVEILFVIFQMHNSIVLPVATFCIVLLCTTLLSLVLRRSRKWRDSHTQVLSKSGEMKNAEPTNAKETSTKEAKAIKMVMAVATVFIVTSIPSCIHMFVVVAIPEYHALGRYSNINVICGHLYFVIESANCSANVIIYYRMSTKFRLNVRKLLCRQQSRKS